MEFHVFHFSPFASCSVIEKCLFFTPWYLHIDKASPCLHSSKLCSPSLLMSDAPIVFVSPCWTHTSMESQNCIQHSRCGLTDEEKESFFPQPSDNSLLPAAQELHNWKSLRTFCQASLQLVSHQPVLVYGFISSQVQDLAEVHIGPFLQPAEATLKNSKTIWYIYHSTQFLHPLQSSFVTGRLLDGSLQLFPGTCSLLEPAVLALLELPVCSSSASFPAPVIFWVPALLLE